MKADPKYKERIFCTSWTNKTKEFLTFLKHSKNSLQRLRFLSIERSRDLEIEQVEEALKAMVETKQEPKKSARTKNPTKLKRGLRFITTNRLTRTHSNDNTEKNIILNSEGYNIFEQDDSVRCMRRKSCSCTSCGGLNYYNRVQKKMLFMPQAIDNSKQTVQTPYSEHQLYKLFNILHFW